MASTCQVYDETNSVVLFDLNDPSAANVGDNGYSATELLSDVDLGEPAHEFSRFSSPGTDGGTTVNSRAGFRQLTIPVRIRASSYDNLTTAVGKLSNYLRSGCVIRWQANTSANVRYIDVEPSPAPYVLDGRELSMYLATSLIDTPEGLDLVLTAQPYLRGAELDSSVNVLPNATILRDSNVDGDPDSWTWSGSSTTRTISATDEAFQAVAASVSTRELSYTTGAASASVGQVWTFSVYVRQTSGVQFNGQLWMTWKDSGGGSLSSPTGTSTPLTSAWTRLTVTATAPASTDRIQARIFALTMPSPSTIQMKNAQLELASAASTFRVGSETGSVDPASGMGRTVALFNPGDAPCPVTVVAQDTTSSHTDEIVAVATSKGGSPGTLTTLLNGGLVSQCEAWTASTDTALDTNASSSPGSGNTGMLTTFVTTTLVQRASITNLNAAAHRGRTYRAFLRFTARTATYNGTINLRWSYPPMVPQDNATLTVTAAAVGTYYEADLGLVTCQDASSTGLNLAIWASRSSGTGNLVLDYVLLVPVDEQAATVITSTVVNTNQMRSYPEDSLWIGTTTAGVASSVTVTEVNGPVPFVARPGLNLVQLNLLNSSAAVVTPEGSYTSLARTDATAYRFIFKPRYLG